MRIRRSFAALSAALLATGAVLAGPALTQSAGAAPPTASYSWEITPTGSTDQFRGLAAVSRDVAWVSGESGTVLRTTDGGATWQDVSPPAAPGLALRDIEAFDAQRASVLSIGTGEDSRIYTTTDGGATWTEAFRNTDPAAFYDCMAFRPNGDGLAMSDPVDGYFQIARTTDYGQSWTVLGNEGMPEALPGEFGFAASGTCIISGVGQRYWFATGGVETPRIFASRDGGDTWSVMETPLRGGPSAGIYSVDFRDARRGVVVGGDFLEPDNGADASAYTTDGGTTWTVSDEPVDGYRSGVSFIRGTARTVIAVGPTGSDVSFDSGNTWTHFDDDWYDGIQCARDGACWASGTDGRVAVLVSQKA